MENPLLCFCLRFVLTLIVLLPLHAQTTANAPTATNAQVAQAPDDMTKKITEPVHAGKYTQQLTLWSARQSPTN